jgi:ribosomal protein S18 acetylase RimI-like enzyme
MLISPFDPGQQPEAVRALLCGRLRLIREPYFGIIAPEAFDRFDFSRDMETLAKAGPRVAAIVTGSTIEAIGCWTPLAWDSGQFGFPAARVDVLVAAGDYGGALQHKRQLLEALLDGCRRAGIRHLVGRVDCGDFSSIHALECAGFELIDGIQTLALRLPCPLPEVRAEALEVRLFRDEDLEQVLTIARSSYIFDRFHADSAISPETADAVNEAWVRDSCAGKAAEAVLVAAQGDTVLGYVSCKIDGQTEPALGVLLGTIVMVATSQQARARGVARATTFAALEWFAAQGVGIVEVGTQLRNIPAGRLYESCGFRLVRSSLTLRKLL